QKAAYARKSQAEQNLYVEETRSKARQLFEAGNLEEAKTRVDEVLLVRVDDPEARKLQTQILIQLQALERMNFEFSKLDQPRAAALKAQASELDQRRFEQAQQIEKVARGLQTSRLYDQAAKRFADAADLYRASESAARDSLAKAGNAIQQLRIQAESARTDF